MIFNLDNELIEESQLRLKSISQFLIKNDSLKIEIGVHFDERKENVFPRRYSQKRAEIIKNYLIASNMENERLVAKGYEDQNPLIKNASSKEQHRKNRSVEFRIIEIEN